VVGTLGAWHTDRYRIANSWLYVATSRFVIAPVGALDQVTTIQVEQVAK
jgi:hypothetical protein